MTYFSRQTVKVRFFMEILPMKTHLYTVNRLGGTYSVQELIQHLEGLRPISKRNRIIDRFPNRIENISWKECDGSNCVLINFVKIRMDHGPGRAGHNNAIQGFNLQPNEGFGEETAALFDLDHGHAIVEYNHHGARAGILAEYLEDIMPQEDQTFELLPKLDSEIVNRAARMEVLSKLEIKVAPGRMSAADRSRFGTIEGAFSAAERLDAPTISLTFGGRPGVTAKLTEGVRTIIGAALRLIERDEQTNGNGEPPIVSKLKVTGRDTAHAGLEILDLIKGRLYREHEIQAGPDRRYPIEDRWNLLIRDHRYWRKQIRTS